MTIFYSYIVTTYNSLYIMMTNMVQIIFAIIGYTFQTRVKNIVNTSLSQILIIPINLIQTISHQT